MRRAIFGLVFLGLAAPAERGSSPAEPISLQRATAIAEGLRNRVRQLDTGLGVRNRRHAASFSEAGVEFVPQDASGRPAEDLRLGYRLATIGRGEEVIDCSAPVVPAPEGNVVSFTRGAGVVERYICLDRGVEQTFVLTEKLPGQGDLLITGELSTALEPSRPGAETTESVTFTSPEDGRKAVSYGRVTVLDSSERRTSALVRATCDSITIRVPGGWLDDADYPVTVDPLIGSEILLCDDSAVQAGAQSSQQNPRVASTGSVALVVWEDYRNSAATGCDIYGTRIDASGNVLDPEGIAICRATGDQLHPRVATNGTNFLVVWRDRRDYTTNKQDLYGARVSLAGDVLEPDGQVVRSATTDENYSDIASNGTDYLAVWTSATTMDTEDVYCALITSAGVFCVASVVCDEAGPQYQPRVASNGDNWLVVWGDYRVAQSDMYGSLVEPGGAVFQPNGTVISDAAGYQRNPGLASNGTDYLVAWESGYDIYCAVVTGTGTFPTDDGTVVCSAASTQDGATVASNGADYFVYWRDSRNSGSTGIDLYGARVDAAGTVLDANGVVICDAVQNQIVSTVVSDGTDYCLAWCDYRNQSTAGYDIYCAVITGAGDGFPTDDGNLICGAAQQQETPWVAAGLGGYVAVWRDNRLSGAVSSEIFAARVDGLGNVLDANGLQLTSGFGSNQEYPQVAFNGSVYLAVWQEARGPTDYDIYGTRIDTSGNILDDPAGEVICDAAGGQEEPKIATNGTDFFVVWYDNRNSATTGSDIYGAVVTGAGAFPTDDGTAICTAAEGQYDPRVASNGSDYLVVWQDSRDQATTGSDIYGMRVSASGTPLDTVDGEAICNEIEVQTRPEVASDGTDYLVVWQDYRDLEYDIYCAAVTSDGTYGSDTPICVASDEQTSPDVASNGTDYLVVWADDRGDDRDVYGSRVTWNGSTLGLLEWGGAVISDAVGYEDNPRVASNGTDYLVVWEFEDDSSWLYLVRCAVVFSDGTYPADDGTLVGDLGADQYEPDVVSNGRDYLVAWYEGSGSDDMYATGVDGAGVVGVPGREAISPLADDQYDYSLAAEPLGKYLVVYGDRGENRGLGNDVYGQFVRGVSVPSSGGGGGGCGGAPVLALAALFFVGARMRRTR